MLNKTHEENESRALTDEDLKRVTGGVLSAGGATLIAAPYAATAAFLWWALKK